MGVLPKGHNNLKPSVQDVLLSGEGSLPFPKLRSLSLPANLGMHSRSSTLHQVSSLQSLSLCVQGRFDWPQGHVNIFVALRQSGILLQQVSAPASAPFLDYLASYQGILQEVRIEDSRALVSETSESGADLAARFFRDVIPNHQSSLRKLEIATGYDDGWAFGDLNSNMFIDPLPALEWLGIAIPVTGESKYLVSA